MKNLFLSIILVFFVLPVASQADGKNIIKEILPLSEIGNSIAGTLLLQSPVFHDRPGITDRQILEIIDQFISSGNDDLTDSLLNIYDSILSDAEIQQLRELSDSSAVKNYFNLIPLITAKSIHAVYYWYLANQELFDSLLYTVIPQHQETAKTGFMYSEVELKRGKPYTYRKKAGSRSVYTNKENTYKVRYNNKIWEKINPSSLNPSTDIAFKMHDREVYAIILVESNDLNLKELRYAAIYNLYNASSMYEVISDELRRVNKNEMMSMQFKAIVDNIEIIYYNYYYSGNQHVIQFSTFTGSDSYETEKDRMEDLLNGLIITK